MLGEKLPLSDELKSFLKSKGASLVGFADLREIAPDARDGYSFGISIAKALNPRIMSEIHDGPTQAYYEEYRQVSAFLDTLGDAAAQFIKGNGYDYIKLSVKSGENPATLATKLPHKTVATRAGLGWVGKCALLITEEYGSAVRLTTVLTNAPLAAGQPTDSSECGDCTVCVEVCPAHAVTGRNWEPGAPRDFLYDAFACRQTARERAMEMIGVNVSVCGLCIVSCPWTQRYANKAG